MKIGNTVYHNFEAVSKEFQPYSPLIFGEISHIILVEILNKYIIDSKDAVHLIKNAAYEDKIDGIAIANDIHIVNFCIPTNFGISVLLKKLYRHLTVILRTRVVYELIADEVR